MKKNVKNRHFMTLIIYFSFCSILYSQNKIIPILPESNSDLIYQEGENSIVTNFATSATLNYSASGQRTLQLNTYTNNYKSGAYFTEYVIYVEEEGIYSFWYSGTPPGTKDDIYPSYSSPFTLIIDEISTKKNREDVNVIETYAPGLYWIKAHKLELSKGYHKIRIEINEKRRFDGKYFFYLDSFFLFKGDEKSPGIVPKIFPVNMQNRSIDSAFRDISYYQNNIKGNPKKVENYMSLAHIYILIGDYLNSIKMLSRIIQMEPQNRTARLLLAKTRIWNGNIDKGISLYEDYLSRYPDSLSIWEEAGKISAWVGKYKKSIEIFKSGINIYPQNISLNINMALTYLWDSMVQEGLDILESQEVQTSNNINRISNLTEVYMINGYPDYAVDFYEKSIKNNPQLIELYLNLESLYREIGNIESAEKVLIEINDNFYISDQLKKIMETNKKKLNIKNLFISELKHDIELEPMNMELRELLVQTLFWNGIVDEAIVEYKTIITINHYNEALNFEREAMDLFYIYDMIMYISNHFNNNSKLLNELKNSYYNSIIKYRTALINNNEVEETRISLENMVNRINRLIQQNEYMYNVFTDLKPKIVELNLKEIEEEDFFKKRTNGNGWNLNENDLITELEEVAQNRTSRSFSAFILLRYFLVEGNYDKSQSIVGSLDEFSSRSKLQKYHNLLWRGDKIPPELLQDMIVYFPKIAEEITIIDNLNNILPHETISNEYLTDIYPVIRRIEDEQQRTSLFKKTISEYEIEQKQVIHKKLIRSIYKHQENTHLLRYTIGDYYLNSKNYKKSIVQFKQVIAIDPFNISAIFKLGRLQQLTGKWKEALDSYEYVFNVDPAYQNASIMYNRLSRIHPEFTKGEFRYFMDTSRIEYNEEFSTDFTLNSWVSIYPQWNGNTYLYLKWSELGAPRKYRVDNLLINSRISLSDNSMIISPSLGISVYNNKFDYISPIEDINFKQILNSGTYTPNISLSISKDIKKFTLTAHFATKLLPESSPGEITDITSMSQGYTISGYFPITGKKMLNSLSFRSYFKIDDRSGYSTNNKIFTLAQDFYMAMTLLKDPWTTHSFYSSTTFENSLNSDTLIYYTPLNVFVSKLGGVTSSYLVVNGGTLGLSGRFAAGIYVEKIAIDPVISIIADTDAQVTYTKNSKSLYFKIFGSSSFKNNTTPDYWSLQASIGFNISLYKLLAQ